MAHDEWAIIFTKHCIFSALVKIGVCVRVENRDTRTVRVCIGIYYYYLRVTRGILSVRRKEDRELRPLIGIGVLRWGFRTRIGDCVLE